MSIYLPDIVKSQRNLISKAELPPAKFMILADLLNVLRTNSQTRVIFSQIESELIKRNKDSENNVAKSVEWIRENFLRLKNSKWRNHPNVRDTFDLAERIIFCRSLEGNDENNWDVINALISRTWHLATSHFYPVNGFVGPALNVLSAIAQIIAEFGEEELFKGWAELETIENKQPLNKVLPGYTVKQVKAMDLSQIAEKTGYGFTKFQVQKRENNNSNDNIVLYQQFRLVKLIHPLFVEATLSNFSQESMPKWKESRDTDPATLYHFLKILSEYDSYKEINPQYLKDPTSWEEHEMLAVHVSLKEYFRPFSSSDPKAHPLSSQQIVSLVDTFLNMVEIQVIKLKDHKKTKRPNKNSAKSFARTYITSYLDRIEKEDTLKTNSDMYSEIIKVAQARNDSCLNELSKPLVDVVYRNVLKEKGITRKGGAPKKQHAQVKKSKKYMKKP